MSEQEKSDAEESYGTQSGVQLALHEQVPARDAQSITDEQQNRKIDVLADRIKRGELWIILLTAAMTIAAFAAVYVANKQWLVAERQTALIQEQLKDARNAMHLEHRAWILVESVEMEVAGSSGRSWVSVLFS